MQDGGTFVSLLKEARQTLLTSKKQQLCSLYNITPAIFHSSGSHLSKKERRTCAMCTLQHGYTEDKST